MTRHIYSGICGFGIEIVPKAPCHVARIPAKDIVTLTCETNSATLQVDPRDRSQVRELLEMPISGHDVVDAAIESPHLRDWKIVTNSLVCDWPHTYVLKTGLWPNSIPFELCGLNDERIRLTVDEHVPMSIPEHSWSSCRSVAICHRQITVTLSAPAPAESLDDLLARIAGSLAAK